jgi:hypothetical protein
MAETSVALWRPFCLGEEGRDLDSQSPGYLLDGREGRIPSPSLQAANVGSIDSGSGRQVFLR